MSGFESPHNLIFDSTAYFVVYPYGPKPECHFEITDEGETLFPVAGARAGDIGLYAGLLSVMIAAPMPISCSRGFYRANAAFAQPADLSNKERQAVARRFSEIDVTPLESFASRKVEPVPEAHSRCCCGPLSAVVEEPGAG